MPDWQNANAIKPMTTKPCRTAGSRVLGPHLAAVLLAAVVLSGCALGLGVPASQTVSERLDLPSITGLPSPLAAGAAGALRNQPPAPRPDTALEARSQAQRYAGVVEDYLAGEGYLLARVTPAEITSPDAPIVLRAETGPQFSITRVSIGEGIAIDSETRKAAAPILMRLPVGAPLNTRIAERVESDLLALLRQRGYAFADSAGIDVLASRTDATVEVTYLLSAGPIVRLGDLKADGLSRTRAETIAELRTWEPGSTYTPSAIDRLRVRLRDTNLFDAVAVSIGEVPDTDGLHPVILQLAEAKPRSFGAGVSASTTDGLGADAFWEQRNLTGRADRLRINAEVSEISSTLSALYSRPNIGEYGRTFTAGTSLRNEETLAYDLLGAKIEASLSQPLNRLFTLAAGGVVDITRTQDARTRAVLDDGREQVTLAVPLSATYTDIDDPLDPQHGQKAFAVIENGVSFGAGTPGYTRFVISGSAYRAIADDLIGALRVEYGAFTGSEAVPADRLFFAGGGGSVRGFEFQSLSPKAPDGTVRGGRGVFTASAELRWRQSRRIGYVVFADTGRAADSPDAVFNSLRTSVGAGIRYYPGFGPLRLDIALPVDRRAGEGPIQVYVSIGQAF